MRHPVLQPVEKSPFISRVLAAAAAKSGSYLMKSDRMGVTRGGVTGGDDANPGHPNRNTIPAGCLAFLSDKGGDD